jgi:Uma2 family endonuclease
MSTLSKPHIRPEEYLEQERKAGFKSEYCNGETFAMAGASIRHALIITNLVSEFGTRLRGGPCKVFSTDLRLAVSPAGPYTYPDVMVVCGKEELLDQKSDTLLNPILLIEVLSDSTKDYDRGEKFEQYRRLKSLREYWTVAQDKIHIEQHVRQHGQQWLLTEYFGANSHKLKSDALGIEIGVAEIYEGVDL